MRDKLERLRDRLASEELDRTGRALRITELVLDRARLTPVLAVGHSRFYQLTAAPRPFRGLRDLVIRTAERADAVALRALSDTPAALVDERMARGDVTYLAEHAGRVLAHVWFHRGPTPFAEDLPVFPRWVVPDDAFWCYHAYTAPDARASGVFVKLFQTALRDVLTERAASRVLCRVKESNAPSVHLHERLGFERLGVLISLALPGVRVLSWHGGDGATRRWAQRRDRAAVMRFPPA
ncbi:MAG TPA: GNAT family N-acetyltransferase [Kofleriaceae bacterium]|nr:GNAT family N-acetyltransferase [Kofleriaceae bacterium]